MQNAFLQTMQYQNLNAANMLSLTAALQLRPGNGLNEQMNNKRKKNADALRHFQQITLICKLLTSLSFFAVEFGTSKASNEFEIVLAIFEHTTKLVGKYFKDFLNERFHGQYVPTVFGANRNIVRKLESEFFKILSVEGTTKTHEQLEAAAEGYAKMAIFSQSKGILRRKTGMKDLMSLHTSERLSASNLEIHRNDILGAWSFVREFNDTEAIHNHVKDHYTAPMKPVGTTLETVVNKLHMVQLPSHPFFSV